MYIYVVFVNGQHYEDHYSKNEFVSLEKDDAIDFIENHHGKEGIYGLQLYAELQTWKDGEMIEAKEYELPVK